MTIRIRMHGKDRRIEHITTDRWRGRAGRITFRHRHPVFHLMFITGGKGIFSVNDRETQALPGHFYIINPDEWHYFIGDEREPLGNVECTFTALDDENQPVAANFFDWFAEKRGFPLPESLRSDPIAVPPLLQPYLLDGFERLLEPSGSYMTPEHLSLLVMDLLLRAEETVSRIAQPDPGKSRSGSETISLLARHMRSRLKEHVTLEELSQVAHWTPNYLIRVFKEQTGEPPMAYLQRIRMAEAEKLLLYTDLPVYMVAESVGYEDASYFARVFRQHFGRAPKDYRII